MLIISMKAAFDTCLAFLNHFPLFALMLRAKDSQRLPGGIRFELKDALDKQATDPNSSAVSYIHIEVIYYLTDFFKDTQFTNAPATSPFLSRCVRCLTSTFSLVIDFASTTWHPASSSVLSRDASFHPSTAVIYTACNTVCFRPAVREWWKSGQCSRSRKRLVVEALGLARWVAEWGH
jgi:hypothetical protein